MKVLLTGASGFLGSRILNELSLTHTVTTLGRKPVSNRHIVCDLAEHVPDLAGHSFDFVVHVAGKAHSVPRNARQRADYENVNVQGTIRLLTALASLPIRPQSIVHISTVLVYGRSEGEGLDEQTSLLAKDAYGLSKVRAEAALQTWGKQNQVRLLILRLPLVVAEPPTGNLAAMLQAIRRRYYVRIGDGAAHRSMVRADDVAAVIDRAAGSSGIYNLTDGYHPTVRELEDAIAQRFGRTRIPTIPVWLARAVATIGDLIRATLGRRLPLDSIALQKLTGSLTFSDEAARQHLRWNPRPVLDIFR